MLFTYSTKGSPNGEPSFFASGKNGVRWGLNLTSFALCARSALHFVLFTNLVRTQAYSYSLARIAEWDPYRHQWRYIASSEQPSHTSHKHFNHSKAQSRAANNPSLYSHYAFFTIQSNPISATKRTRNTVRCAEFFLFWLPRGDGIWTSRASLFDLGFASLQSSST